MNENVERYRNYIRRYRVLSGDDIAHVIKTTIQDDLDNNPKDEELIGVLQETIRRFPDETAVIESVLHSLKTYSADEVKDILNNAVINSSSSARNVEQSKKSVSTSAHFTGMQVHREDNEIDNLWKEAEKMYQLRTPMSLKRAKELFRRLLDFENITDYQAEDINARLRNIADIVARDDFTEELPEDVAIEYNKHRTPLKSGMFGIALKHVRNARNLMEEHIKSDPEKYSSFENWSDASSIVKLCEEKIASQKYKEQAEDAITDGDWRAAIQLYGAYLTDFPDDKPIKEKQKKLENFLEVTEHINNIATGQVEPQEYTQQQIANYINNITSVSHVLGRSGEFGKLRSDFFVAVKRYVENQLEEIKDKLSHITQYKTMSEVEYVLLDSQKKIDDLKDVVKDSFLYDSITQSLRSYLDKFNTKYLQAKNKLNENTDQSLIEAFDYVEQSQNTFGSKDEFAEIKYEISQEVVKLSDDLSPFLNVLFFLPKSRRAKTLLHRAEKSTDRNALRDSETYHKVKNKFHMARNFWIVIVIIVVLGISVLLYKNNETMNIAKTQTAIALLTPTPSFTPVVITNTPLPPTDVPTATPVPTTMPIGRAEILAKPYYVYLYGKPGGEDRLNAFLSNTHIIDVQECVVLDNGAVWLNIIEEDDKISGWVQLNYVKIIQLEENLDCHPISN